MAKEHVGTIERHVEKVVAGVAGAVLLAVLVLYLVGSPNKVEVAGETVGPKQLYDKLDEKARQAAATLQRGSEEEVDGIPPISEGLRILETAGLKRELPMVFATLGPTVPPSPDIGGGGPGLGTKELAEVIAPTRPVLNAGRASVVLQPPEVAPVVGNAPTDPDKREVTIATDYNWVTLAGIFNRREQMKRCEEAGWLNDRAAPLVAAVDFERQELLPNGTWSEPAVFENGGYAAEILQDDRTTPVLKQPDGTFAVTPQGRELIQGYVNKLSTLEAQEAVLRPAFQALIGEEMDEWKIPKQLKAGNATVDMTDLDTWNVYFASEDDDATGGPGGREQNESARRRKAMDDLKAAKDAIQANKWIEAQELLDAVLKNSDAPPPTTLDAEKLLKDNEARFQQAVIDAEKLAESKALKSDIQLGPDLDPYWVTDLNVSPGKTYRYRVRVAMVNRFAGQPSNLSSPQDAGKVLLEGQWSAWTDPITVPKVQHILLTRLRDGKAEFNVAKWERGEWDKGGRLPLEVGDTVEPGDTSASTMVLAHIAEKRPFLSSQRSPDGSEKVVEQEVEAALLVRLDGEIEEHLEPQDKEILSVISREQRERLMEERKKAGTLPNLKRERRPVGGGGPVRRPAGGSERGSVGGS